MAYSFEKTSHPGIYKRPSGSYAIVYRLNGKQKWEGGFRTLDEARRAKATRTADIERGEFHEQSRVTFVQFATEWIERYQGGRRGFREDTRDDYRRQLKQYAFKFFPERLRLTAVTPSHIARFVAWLAEDQRGLADGTIRNVLAPVRACLSTAVKEGLLRSNPARDIDLPHRQQIVEDEDEDARPFTTEQLSTFLRVVHPQWRTFFELLATTGMRISEIIALEWRHVHLDGSSPHVKVRQRVVRNKVGPPKSRRGRRDIPINHELVLQLRERHSTTEWPRPNDPVFPSRNGTVLRPNNIHRRILKPTVEEAGAPSAAFHTFRHTCAAMLIAEGRNIVQISRWLGHHSPSFTLQRYGGLMNEHLGEALVIAPVDAPSVDDVVTNNRLTRLTPLSDTQE